MVKVGTCSHLDVHWVGINGNVFHVLKNTVPDIHSFCSPIFVRAGRNTGSRTSIASGQSVGGQRLDFDTMETGHIVLYGQESS